MIIISCVDDNYGLLFNHRRQSQDRIVREDIIKEIKPNKLWLNHYSAKQFLDYQDHIQVAEDFMEKAKPQQYCFVENIAVSAYEKQIDKIILYHWNRKYPADFYFDIELQTNWLLEENCEFQGSSHENVGKIIYIRRN